MSTHPDTGDDQRVRIADVAAMRHRPGRLIRATVIVLALLTFFTAGGVAMLLAGELPGLPFAVGGAIAQISVLVLLVTTLRLRATLAGDTVPRNSMASARTTFAGLRAVLLFAMVGLVVYGLVRALQSDAWTLLTTLIVAVPLWLLARGLRRLRDGLDAALTARQT